MIWLGVGLGMIALGLWRAKPMRTREISGVDLVTVFKVRR